MRAASRPVDARPTFNHVVAESVARNLEDLADGLRDGHLVAFAWRLDKNDDGETVATLVFQDLSVEPHAAAPEVITGGPLLRGRR